MKKLHCFVLSLISCVSAIHAIGDSSYVKHSFSNDFCIVRQETAASIVVDSSDYIGVLRAAGDLQHDIQSVTSKCPKLSSTVSSPLQYAIIIGTIGKSKIIDRLIADKKINVDSLKNRWEGFAIQVLEHPTKEIGQALVIAGSDKQGTIYGIYDLSEQIGVSPWYWWDDITPQHQQTLTISNSFYKVDWPAVKYRGIFINDEAPALSGWMKKFYGGVFNHDFYAHVFELILRLKGNYLWPAMWASAFNEDDPLNPKLADEYGIVMGTSHHEPMMRAQQEWKREGSGVWNFQLNKDTLLSFWKKGIQRNKNYDNLITIGMRGDGDKPMEANNSLKENISLLQQIIADQQKILAEYINPNTSKVPQLWTLYKEVQDYYDHGMKVPDYVTLLWCDDNWGNIRRLPTAEERKRSGGAGIYYHMDYVGGPRSYKWINTVPVAKIWEQMSKAYQYGADRVWIVNVGDIKPLEYSLEFFLNLGWKPSRWNKDNLSTYSRQWAQLQFGTKYADTIADILAKYTKYNGWIKPELISPSTFSLTNYREAETVLNKWESLSDKAEAIYATLDPEQKDAFYQLVLYPVKASYTVTALYINVAKNRLYASQGRISADIYAAKSKALFVQDSLLTLTYHKQIAGGKWDGMINQPHIGYTGWSDPAHNIMPRLASLKPANLNDKIGIAIEGNSSASTGIDKLPTFSNYSREQHYLDLFAKQSTPIRFTITTNSPWILPSIRQGMVPEDKRVEVDIDWAKAPQGNDVKGSITINGAKQTFSIEVKLFNPATPDRNNISGFVESNGYVAMEAEHYSANHAANGVSWQKIPDYGRTLSSMMPFPATAKSFIEIAHAPYLEYNCYLFTTGNIELNTLIAPTLNCLPDADMRFAIAIDDEQPQTVQIPRISINGAKDNQVWSQSVIDNIRVCKTFYDIKKQGYHTIKIYMIDPGVVIQRIILNTGGLKPSFFFPPESLFLPDKPKKSSKR